jgi:hypothetical protein
MIAGTVGVPVLLELALADRATGMFPRVLISDSTGTQVGSPADLTASSEASWMYVGTWTPPTVGQFSALFQVYTDVGHTLTSVHSPEIEHIQVSAVDAGTALVRILGHAGENVRDDALTYDLNKRPLTFRRRIFPDAATAAASTPGGTGQGEIATIMGVASHFDAAEWETLLRTYTP